VNKYPMQIHLVLQSVLMKVVLSFIAVYLYTTAVFALDVPSADRDAPAKRNNSPSVSSPQISPSAEDDKDGRIEDLQPDAPDNRKSDSGMGVLDVANVPLKAIGGVVDATRDAIRSYLAGNKEEAVKSLSYAADQGHAPAQWKLARMYAEGDGVPRDELRAFENFSQVCDRHADEAPESPTAPFVSSAFIALGSYYLNGIPNSSVKSDPTKAREMFAYSASYFGDPEAQLVLARLYLDGIGGPKDTKQALRWLNLSAEKGNHLAQAELGKLLFSGEVGAKQRARGLMWLTLASDAADPVSESWIIEANDVALSEASETDRLASNAYLAQRKRRSK
jgi:TPR repeat protein